MENTYSQSHVKKDDRRVPIITRVLADKQIEDMMIDCRPLGNNSYIFPKFGNLRVNLRQGKVIREWVTKYIESRCNIKNIENSLKNNTHAKKK